MTKKERSIVACHLQAEKYRNPKEGDIFFNVDYCYLCKIHYYDDIKKYKCKGCPLGKELSFGCSGFATYIAVTDLMPERIYDVEYFFPKNPSTQLLDALEQRAKFYDWLAVELEKYPASQFTKKGWKDFEIDKNL